MALGFCPVTSGLPGAVLISLAHSTVPSSLGGGGCLFIDLLPTVPHASDLPESSWYGSAGQGLSITQS